MVQLYGTWKSPFTAEMIAAGSVRFGDLQWDGNDLYWLESRPAEKGRNTIMRYTGQGSPEERLPSPYSARSRVHEYGGGAFVAWQGALFFSNGEDKQIYRMEPGRSPLPLTRRPGLRFANPVVDGPRRRLIVVQEDHTREGPEPENTLAAIPLEGGSPQVLVSGHDFYASPALSPDGRRLAYLAWNHPNMPWDGTELWLAELSEDGQRIHPRRIAGGAHESIFQPQWSPEGTLYFVSDRSGWWNLYRLTDDGTVHPVLPMEAEFGLPQWVFGMSTYGFASAEEIIAAFSEGGIWRLGRIDVTGGRLTRWEMPFTYIEQVRVGEGRAAFFAASPAQPLSLVVADTHTGNFEIIRTSVTASLDSRYISLPESITFPTGDGEQAHAFFYPPTNPDYTPPSGTRPPLIVLGHSGPTGATDTRLNLKTQFWTGRGFAVLDVNYRGSTGYGRAYRERLNGNWGVVDVEDCINGARFLVQQGRVNPEQLIIRGSSAGGYTVLAALTFHDLFRAGACYYGIADLERLVQHNHKFESRYFDRLIGPYPAQKERYRRRSPIHFTDRLNCPVIFFQGSDDPVVPPEQMEMMVEALKRKGMPVACVMFPGEGHGFRKADTIRRALENELYFYGRVFKLPLSETVEPITIENL